MNDNQLIYEVYYNNTGQSNYNGKYEDTDGVKYYKNSELHRDDGPAIENNDGSVGWFQKGQFHREDGPAILGKDMKEVYALKDKLYHDTNKWAEAVLELQGKPNDPESVAAFLKPILSKQAKELI